MYWVNATVGTPGQLVQLQIDTGSSDVWVFGPHSCVQSTSPCLGGYYDGSQSSTYKLIDRGGFNITYQDNSGARGDYVSDDFAIGAVGIKDLTIAVATEATGAGTGTGVMGIGFDSNESIVASGGKPYKNIIDVMVDQGLINSHAYSLWLNDVGAQTGTILFGGYDTGKFRGKLVALPIQPDQTGQITSMSVAWTSLSITDPTQGTQTLTGSNFAQPVILDSGTTLTYVPPDLYYQVASFANVMSAQNNDGGLVECEVMQSYKGTLNFGFDGAAGPVISVPFPELSFPYTDQNGNAQKFDNGNTVCQFGLAPAEENAPLLFGDTFLRSAYVVYDLDRQQIAIAPTVFNSDITNIVELGPPGSSATPTWHVANAVSVQQMATGPPEKPGLFAAGTATVPISFTQTASGFHLSGSSIPPTSGPSQSSGSAASSGSTASGGVLANVAIGSLFVFVGSTLLLVA
ncbi:probable aspartic-type endopeptidase OPSB [Aspergillus udagawae]|nr:probable aspartic-type endopeptidase OPSB [Aspergillus udagawae]